MLFKLIAGCALAATTMGAAVAQKVPSSGAMSDVTSSPAAYVAAAGQSDQFEIQEGQMAQSMGKAVAVRKFGAQMVRDHTKSTKMVMAAAAKSGLPPMPPPPLRPDQQQMISQLQSTSGSGFDQAYVQQQMQAHQEALQLQQTYSQGGTDPNLKAVATKIVPVIQEHLSMLQTMPAM